MAGYVRQAVVVIHGMGEQLPLTTVTEFIATALEPDASGKRTYYSRPESVTGSYESRRFLAPPLTRDGRQVHAQTEFFEYHWAHFMQGNRFGDLLPAFRRLLLQWPTRVPKGLKVFWGLTWALILAFVWAVVWGPWAGAVRELANPVAAFAGALATGGAAAMLLASLIARAGPKWLTSNFVDVVRYLDTSPRSYEVRRQIRKGMVEMLQALQESRTPRYDRVIVVAHSLGAFIAYDAIAYLWGLTNGRTGGGGPERPLGGLRELEEAASALPDRGPAPPGDLARYRRAQRTLWRGIRAQGNPWIITDFVSVGSPMYFADQLLHGKGEQSFARRIERRELPTCPPQNEETKANNIHGTKRFFSWEKQARERQSVTPSGRKSRWVRVRRRVLYEGAPFAVVRWTNLWFPARLGLFGDWFGGPASPLFGAGIKDVELTGNTLGNPGTWLLKNRSVPAYAHSLYFGFPDDDAPGSAAREIRDGMDLASASWAAVDAAGADGGGPFPAP